MTHESFSVILSSHTEIVKVIGTPVFAVKILVGLVSGEENPHMTQDWLSSPSRIVQITDFLEFLQEYCKEKSETFITEF